MGIDSRLFDKNVAKRTHNERTTRPRLRGDVRSRVESARDVLDEIGGFELVIPQFRAQLAAFLSSPVPCLGVLKSPAGVEELRERFGLGEKYAALAKRLREALDADPDTLVLDLASRGDERAERAVREWAAAFT